MRIFSLNFVTRAIQITFFFFKSKVDKVQRSTFRVLVGTEEILRNPTEWEWAAEATENKNLFKIANGGALP